MDIKKNNKNTNSFAQIVVAFVTAGIVILLLGSGFLVERVERMEYGKTRETLLSVLYPLDRATGAFRLDFPQKGFSAIFDNVKNARIKTGFAADEFFNRDKGGDTDEGGNIYAVKSENNISDSGEPATVHSSENPLKVLLIGDSMMGSGLGTTLVKVFTDDTLFTVYRNYELSSGLARMDFFDWYEQTEALTSANDYDIIIAVLGTNDGQSIKADSKTVRFATPRWKELYKLRVRRYLEILEDKAPFIYWLGLPPMMENRLDYKVGILNSIYSGLTGERENIRYFPIAPYICDSEGKYTSYMRIGNKVEVIRTKDGIHFTDAGGRLIADALVRDIRERLEAEAGETGTGEVVSRM